MAPTKPPYSLTQANSRIYINYTVQPILNTKSRVDSHCVHNDTGLNKSRPGGIRNAISALSKISFTLLTIALTFLTVTLTLGQYYQGGYLTRINVTTLWKNGYSADTRNRVTKFNAYYKDDPAGASRSFDNLADPQKVFSAEVLRSDLKLMRLLASDLEDKWRGLQDNKKLRVLPDNEKWQNLSDNDIIEAALKYRNAFIECLNTMEAVKAVIQKRPWFGINPDSLEVRYNCLITDLTKKLHPFILSYRQYNRRPTDAWFILTQKNDAYTACTEVKDEP